MNDIDFFEFWRWLLALIVTIYATIVTLQTLWSYYVWLSATDRYTILLRRYVILQSLRLRFRKFAGDLLVCVLLCVAFALLLQARGKVKAIEAVKLGDTQQFEAPERTP